MNLKPLRDHVLVEPAAGRTQTKGGIIIPDSAQERPAEGKVVAIGTGHRGKKGKLEALTVKKGDRVIYGKWSATEIKLENKDYLILREQDILGVVEGDGKVSVRSKVEPGSAAASTAACSLDHIHGDDCGDDC